jgi:hypothetical protein
MAGASILVSVKKQSTHPISVLGDTVLPVPVPVPRLRGRAGTEVALQITDHHKLLKLFFHIIIKSYKAVAKII